MDSNKHIYVALSGIRSVVRDVEKARDLWTHDQQAYHPDGPEDERLALLRVRIERAEYRKAAGPAAYFSAAEKAAAKGLPVGIIGENHKVR